MDVCFKTEIVYDNKGYIHLDDKIKDITKGNCHTSQSGSKQDDSGVNTVEISNAVKDDGLDVEIQVSGKS